MRLIRTLVCLLFALATLAACSGGPPAGSATPARTGTPGQPTSGPTQPNAPEPTDEGEPTPGTALTACELVAADDIEAALELDSGSVAPGELEQQPTVLDPATNECRYDDEWGGLVVHVTPTDGVNVYDALVNAYSDKAEALDIGDGALWFENNDRGYFLQGSVMVLLQFTHIVDTELTSFRDPTVALGQAAVAKI